MKKHFLFLLFMVAFFTQSKATVISVSDSVLKRMPYTYGYMEELATPLKPSYLRNGLASTWTDNWFVNVSGGVSAFLGSPLGCEDLLGRIKPSFALSVGKWHTPVVGNRLSFQGFEWKNCELATQRYRHYHADLLINLTPALGIGGTECRFDLIPFVGVGLIDNRTIRHHLFAINYGLQGRYRISKCLHVTAELGNANTFSDADGVGNAHRLGDNLLTFSAGVSWTFGKNVGWKKVVDARPYIARNEKLVVYLHDEYFNSDNYKTNERGEHDKDFPINDYSGLNSLRKRLRESENGTHTNVKYEQTHQQKTTADSLNGAETQTKEKNIYSNISLYPTENTRLGVPVFFFFELGTTELVDASQLVNLQEIAHVAIHQNLRVEIIGAADAATGNEQINDELGVNRAKFIADYLRNEGVEPNRIVTFSAGGISTYSPCEANRNSIVRLFLP